MFLLSLLLILFAIPVIADQTVYGDLYVQDGMTGNDIKSRTDQICNSSDCYSIANFLNNTGGKTYTAGSNISIVSNVISWSSTWVESMFITQAEEGNLNVNSSTWWNSASGWVSRWFYKTGNDLNFNESLLNDTIDSRAVTTEADPIWISEKSDYYTKTNTISILENGSD